jgi:trimethylamine--corrinoid protein Co-methyltransferase
MADQLGHSDFCGHRGVPDRVALAGALVQCTAEALSIVTLVNPVVPGGLIDFGPWTFVSELRIGAAGMTVALSALAGGTMICEYAGLMGSLMGCSLEAMLLEEDLIGAVQRSLRGIEVTAA